jgi:hypothetical protein
MTEAFPVAAGAVAGILVQRLLPGRLRLGAMLLLAFVLGLTASAISGELALSLGFIPIDVVEVLGIGLVVMALLTLWERRTLRVR